MIAFALAALVALQCPDGSPPPCRGARAPAANSVAVLPFENRAGDSSLTLLAEGIADQVTTILGQVEGLAIKPPATVRFVMRSTPREPGRLARALDARWLVDGQLLASRGRVRVSVQLVDASRQQVRWSGAFQRASDDVFAVISGVADSVASAIIGTLAPTDRARLARRPTINNAAMSAYVRGIAALHRHDEGSVRYALHAFEEATAADSTFSRAWAGIAESLTWLDTYQPPREVYPRARAAVQRALALEPGLPEALAALASITLGYDWNPVRAESLARDALRRDSTQSHARLFLADALAAQGHAEEAAAAYHAALAADSLDEEIAIDAAVGLRIARPEESLTLSRRWRRISTSPDWWDGMEAANLVALRLCASSPPAAPITPIAFACAGQAPRARAMIDSVAADIERGGTYRPAVLLAATYMALGDREAAIRWLERCFSDRSFAMIFAPVEPVWNPLRGDPRFIALLQRVRPAAE